MIPLSVFLTAAALFGVAATEMAFSLLMRLPQRLEAEREVEGEGLRRYLEDPLKFFVPARVMRAALLVLMMVLLVQAFGTGIGAAALLLAVSLGIYLLAGHLLPALVVRRSPQRVLDLLLPLFSAVARVLLPFTSLIIAWLGHRSNARERRRGRGRGTGRSVNARRPAPGRREPAAAVRGRLRRDVGA